MSGGRRYAVLLAALSLLTAALFAVSLSLGPSGLSAPAAVGALFGHGDPAAILVMREIRLPRAILGAMIGASLGLSGAVLQGYLRNPLAEPGLIGVSGSAALGAVIAIYTGAAAAFPLALPLSALAGAVVAVALLQALAGAHSGPLTLILAGVALSSVAAALTSLALNISPNPFAAAEIMFWMMGSLSDRSMLHVGLSAPFMIVGWALLGCLGRPLDALTLGPETAASMGVRLGRLRALAVLGTASAVGAATAVAGAVGFVGLVAPHVMRPLVDQSPSRLLPASALAGASLLLCADIATRLIPTSRDLKLGVLTAVVGAPFFLWLVLKTRRSLA
ncbi:MAG: ABC transporter permease [Leifsonia xyli]|nr:MAG: ABC transporter permease [Leifsonia xyli]